MDTRAFFAGIRLYLFAAVVMLPAVLTILSG